MVKSILRSRFTYWIIFLFGVVLIWWIILQSTQTGGTQVYLFNWFYGLIALSGGIYAIKIALTKWGGVKSVIGRGLIFLSLGLLGQWFGLQVWTYYNVVLKNEIPYPSLADIGYFALIPTYAYASFMFAKASGGNFFLKTKRGKIQALIIPILVLVIVYGLFLKNIGFDLSDGLKLFLDIGYPLGEIIPISIALFTFTLSKNLLGGTMRKRILFLVTAFSFQFLTEYTFLYRVASGTYYNGGFVDLMYATSYTIMSLAISTFSNYD